MVQVLLNYDNFLAVKEKYNSIRVKNLSWKEKNVVVLNSVVEYNSGKWGAQFDTNENQVLAEFMQFSSDTDLMCRYLDDADGDITKMLNRCGDFYNTLDGNTAPTSYSSSELAGEHCNELKYDDVSHDSITSGCESILDDADLEANAVKEIRDLMEKMVWKPKSCLNAELDAFTPALTKQGYIEKFADSFARFVSEVDSFNTTISSKFSDVVGELETVPEFTRENTYEERLEQIQREKEIAWIKSMYLNTIPAYADKVKQSIDLFTDPKHADWLHELYLIYCNAPAAERAALEGNMGYIFLVDMQASHGYASGTEIHLNYEAMMKDGRGYGFTIFHESGHAMLANSGAYVCGGMNDFDNAVKKDVQAYINKFEATGKPIDDILPGDPAAAFLMILDMYSQNPDLDGMAGVSDMIDGTSNDKYQLGYGHGSYADQNGTYWDKDPTNLSNETFANIFAMEMCNDEKQIEFVKENFPNVYEEYEKLLPHIETRTW